MTITVFYTIFSHMEVCLFNSAVAKKAKYGINNTN